MKIVSTLTMAALVGYGHSQMAGNLASNGLGSSNVFGQNGDIIGFTETGNDKDVDTGENSSTVVPQSNISEVMTLFEKEADQKEIDAYQEEYISTQKKKNTGIYDPNMYPYGPMHGDYRAPGSDDAVSDAINLPSPFPMFNGQSTNTIRASTNGMVILDDRQIFENNPTELPSIEIDTPFVAGFWNDIWSKKHGKIYWRLEQTNTTLLDEMRADIIDGFPELAGIGYLKYAFVYSFYKVTHYGARKSNGMKYNTFQIIIATDGEYSFLINNYQDINWNIALGATNKAVGGFDIDNTYYTMMEGSLEDGSLDWQKTSTNSATPGRHIFRLDDMDPPTPIIPDDGDNNDNDDNGNGDGGLIPSGVVHADQIWPANDNTLGGGIFKYVPPSAVGNGTCTIQFPSAVAWFHVFDAHIRADAAVTSMVWKIVAANPTFEPNQADGSFTFAIQFNRGFEFTEAEITMTCDEEDEYTYAVYSFPQNHLQESGRSNLRKRDNQWDPAASYAITFASPVTNFVVDDPRIQVATTDNMSFILTEIPATIEEVWFSFEYINYFGSNEVGVIGQE